MTLEQQSFNKTKADKRTKEQKQHAYNVAVKNVIKAFGVK